MKFRKKPVVIETVQWLGTNDAEMAAFCTAAKFYYPTNGTPALVITTLEGAMNAQVGDWIIKGVAGEFYPCKASIFDASYEPA